MLARAAVCLALSLSPAVAADWNPRLAAQYLDSRQKEWFAWPRANAGAKPCISCHTGMTYLLARPALRKALGEDMPTEYEVGAQRSQQPGLENLIDRHAPYRKKSSVEKEAPSREAALLRVNRDYMDEYINPPEFVLH